MRDIRFYWKLRGAHVWVRVFTTRLVGTLTFSAEEWPEILHLLNKAGVVKKEFE